MAESIIYRKVVLRCSARQFGALVRTLQRDGAGLWPPHHPRLELCAVENERFDDPFLAAGWVVYEAPRRDACLSVDFDYAAGTIEVYDMPGERCAVYFTDGQEPGGFRARPIGPWFAALLEVFLRQLASLTV